MALAEKYVRADAGGSGDGSADNSSDAWTLAQALANYAAGARINIKAGTYTLSANSTPTTSGTETAPVIFRGYYSTPGDLDYVPRNRSTLRLDPTLVASGYAFPEIQHSSYYIDTGAQSYITWANLKFTGTTGRMQLDGSLSALWQIVSETSGAVDFHSVFCPQNVTHCDFVATGLATGIEAAYQNLNLSRFVGNYVNSNRDGVRLGSSAYGSLIAHNVVIAGEIPIDAALLSHTNSNEGVTLLCNTVAGGSGNGITAGGYPGTDATRGIHYIVGNHATDNGGYGIQSGYAGTGDTAGFLAMNRTRDNTSGATNGYGDWATGTSFGHVTDDDSTAEFVDYANDNLRLVPGAAAIGKGLMFHTIGALPDLAVRGRTTFIGGLG